MHRQPVAIEFRMRVLSVAAREFARAQRFIKPALRQDDGAILFYCFCLGGAIARRHPGIGAEGYALYEVGISGGIDVDGKARAGR